MPVIVMDDTPYNACYKDIHPLQKTAFGSYIYFVISKDNISQRRLHI